MMTAGCLSKRLSKCLGRLPAISFRLSKRLSKVVETGDRFRVTRCGLGWSRVRDEKNKDENNNKLLYRGAPNEWRPVWFAGRFAGSDVGCKVLTMLLVSRSR